jgi:hypothetical protein
MLLIFKNQIIMKSILLYTTLACSLFAFSACTEEPEEKNSAVITITGPVMDGLLHHNDTLEIRGTIVSTMDLHGYNVNIRRTDTQAEVFYYDDHYHGNNKNLNIDWPCTLNENVQLRLTITARLDHEGNAAIKSVDFNCQP